MTHPVAPVRPSDPTEVGPFHVQGRLGSGGMGVVYLGAAADGSQAAVKVVHSALAEQPDFRARLAREVDAVSRIRSPFVASLVAADTQSASQWIATQYIPGPTLAEQVAADGPLPDLELFGVLEGLALALHDVHRAGISHRDIKPSNVIMSPSGPRLIDFGIAQALDATALTRTGASLGTAVWMAPEQVSGLSTSPATDVFAWGLLAAWAATGHHPYGTGRPEVVAVRIGGAAPVLVGVPEWLIGLVRAALDRDPGARPTATELLGALRAARATQHAAGRLDAGAARPSHADAPTLLDPVPMGAAPAPPPLPITAPAGAAPHLAGPAPDRPAAPAARGAGRRAGARLGLAAAAVLLAGFAAGALAWSPWSAGEQVPPASGSATSAPVTPSPGSAEGAGSAVTTSSPTPTEEPAESPTESVPATPEPTQTSQPSDSPATTPPSEDAAPSDQDSEVPPAADES